MIYDLSLRTTGIFVGILLLVAHAYALADGDRVKRWLKDFPRSSAAGIALLVLVVLWSLWLVATMDLGEFTAMRTVLMIAIPVGGVLTARFVDEFLAVRTLGMLLLLAACPLLDAAFLKPPASRLLLVVVAYAWIVKGIFWIGFPYWMRDQIAWLTSRPVVWKLCCAAGTAYGLLLLVYALGWGD